MEHIGKARYAIVDNGVFQKRIVCGIVTGVEYTEITPIYTIVFGKNKYRVGQLYSDKESLIAALDIPNLDKIAKSNELKIKYDTIQS